MNSNDSQSSDSEERVPAYNEKCDIFSLGILFFDIISPLPSAMQERQEVYDDLTKNYKVPKEVEDKFPEEVRFCYFF